MTRAGWAQRWPRMCSRCRAGCWPRKPSSSSPSPAALCRRFAHTGPRWGRPVQCSPLCRGATSRSPRYGQILAPALHTALRANPDAAADLRRWRFCYADERVVPLDHADSNHAACQRDLFAKVRRSAPGSGVGSQPRDPCAQIGAESDTVITIDPLLAPEECARDYAAALAATGKAAPDLALLGMGPDGHTASLFPGHPLAEGATVGDSSVAPITDSPKPPPQRVTLTLPALCRCRHAAFVVSGASKAGAVARAVAELLGRGREGGPPPPAARCAATAAPLRLLSPPHATPAACGRRTPWCGSWTRRRRPKQSCRAEFAVCRS